MSGEATDQKTTTPQDSMALTDGLISAIKECLATAGYSLIARSYRGRGTEIIFSSADSSPGMPPLMVVTIEGGSSRQLQALKEELDALSYSGPTPSLEIETTELEGSKSLLDRYPQH
jgi:hypothetical protein